MARQLVKDLYEALMLDIGLGNAAIVDFGIGHAGSEQHSALQKAVRNGATANELDVSLGNGQKISLLVERHTKLKVKFRTAWDAIREVTQRRIDELDIQQVITEDERTELFELYEAIKSL